jgi:predicted nucleotidyltransferase
MGTVRVEVVDGKALYDGQSLISWSSRVADRIVERCGASRIVLHGSVARGDDGPDSDIDLLVIMSPPRCVGASTQRTARSPSADRHHRR